MLLLAICPPLWRRVMDARVLAHYDGDISRTALQPGYEARLRKRYPAAR